MADKELQVRDDDSLRENGGEGSEPARETSKEARGGFGILKPGRGYWVRVMTAVCLGTLFLSMALWAWRQCEAYEPPVHAWTMRVSQLQGTTPQPGAKVELFKLEDNNPVKIGDGEIESSSTEGDGVARLSITRVILTQKEDSAADTKRVSVTGTDGTSVFSANLAGVPGKVPTFQKVYVQGAAAAIIVLLGLYVIYRIVGNRPGSVDFLIATDEEMRKVNWSTRKIIMDSTSVVIGATLLIALFIFTTDLVLKQALLNRFVSR